MPWRRCTTAVFVPRGLRIAGYCRESRRRTFYDEGEDFWPKALRHLGRLAAQQPDKLLSGLVDSKISATLSPVFPGAQANTLAELACQLKPDAENLPILSRSITVPANPVILIIPCLTTALLKPDAGENPLGAPASDAPPQYGYALRPASRLPTSA